jgi:hypothetical protein
MDIERYVAFLNDTIEMDFGVIRHPDGSVTVTDCYRNTHRLMPEMLARLSPSLQIAIDTCMASNETTALN